MNNSRASYEDKLTRLRREPSETGSSGDPPSGSAVQAPARKHRRSKTPDAGDSETKKELKKARHIMKQLEAKMKVMEEENSKSKVTAVSPPEKSVWERQVKIEFEFFVAQMLLEAAEF